MALMIRLEESISPSALLGALAAAVILKISVVSLETGFLFAYLPIAIVIWGTANYFVEIIEQRAIGEGWGVFSLDTVATLRNQLGALLVLELAVIVGVFMVLEARVSRELAWAFAALAVGVGPASIALLAVTRDALRALAPLDVLRAALRMGVRYAGLVLGLILVVGLVIVAYRQRGFVVFFAAPYAAFWLAYSIGSVVYSKRSVLGVHAPRAPEAKLARALERLVRARQRALDHAYGVASRGNFESAFAYINEYAATESEPLAARQWMYFEMTRWASPRPALAFGARLAADLEAGGEPGAAAKVRTSCAHLETQLRGR